MAVFDDTPRDWKDKTLTVFAHKAEYQNGVPEFVKGQAQRIAFEEQEPLKTNWRIFWNVSQRKAYRAQARMRRFRFLKQWNGRNRQWRPHRYDWFCKH